MYANGEGTPQDYTEAVRWLRLAAAQDYSTARYLLGVMYADGADAVPPSVRRVGGSARGIPALARRSPNDVEAYKWFSLAASRVNGEEQRFYAEIRDRAGRKLGSDQLADAQRLAGEWQADFELTQAE
jgi:TPR repeat protein